MLDDKDFFGEDLENDPRIGSKAIIIEDGDEGTIESITRFSDGVEYFDVFDERTGYGCGGLTSDKIKIEE